MQVCGDWTSAVYDYLSEYLEAVQARSAMPKPFRQSRPLDLASDSLFQLCERCKQLPINT